MKEQEVVFAMRQIARALERSPAIADTARGIHDFWVGWREPVPDLDITKEALERLRHKGVMSLVVCEGGRKLWKAANAKDAKPITTKIT
jgi:hypothetical protein